MRTRTLLSLALGGLLVAGAAFDASAADKDTLVIALDTLGAQVMDPIMDTRAPHAHYHAPVWDSLVGFDFDNGGIGPYTTMAQSVMKARYAGNRIRSTIAPEIRAAVMMQKVPW